MDRRGALIFVFLSACASPRVSRLPADFHWGVATSGFQSEGSFPDSNWTRYSKSSAPYRDSVDFYRRFPEDVQLAAGLGVNTFRFSIEWARVMPKRGTIDEAALAHYDALFDELKKQGITPMVTLLHFVTPGWVLDEGGLGNDAILSAWSEFVRVVSARYASRGAWWITINEASYFLTLERKHGSCPDEQVARAKDRLVEMHRRAYELIKSSDAKAMISANVVWEPAPASWFDDWFFDRVSDRIDYVAIDYYYSVRLDLSVVHAARGQFWRVNFTPSALLTAIRDYHRRAPSLPVYVVENGMATDDGLARRDRYTRSQHLRDHLYWVQRARDEGIDVIGFNVWSLTDNYEWGDYRNRFGLYTVDVESDPELGRKPTDAVDAYRTLVKEQGVPADYVPVK